MSSNPAEARNHLSPGILRVVDAGEIEYKEMVLGQTIQIVARDAVSAEFSSFTVVPVSIRTPGINPNLTDVTFLYVDGEFNFYNADDPKETVRIEPGTLMEHGLSCVLIPKMDAIFVNLGGIGLGRDYSFEHVGGTNVAIAAKDIETINIGIPPKKFNPPDLSDYFTKVEESRKSHQMEEEQRAREVTQTVTANLEELLRNDPQIEEIKRLVLGCSTDGKLYMVSYLSFAYEDGVMNKALKALKGAFKEHFDSVHPQARGDLRLKASSRIIFDGMIKEAGIEWPRPHHMER